MSEAADSAHVRIWLADYASVDPQGKINALGAGITVTGRQPQSNVTAPFAVVAIITFGPQFAGENPAIELRLEDENGAVFALPAGPLGNIQYIRVGSSDPLPTPASSEVHIPPGSARPKAQFILYFSNGLPLDSGRFYRWRVSVDHQTRDEWTETLYVPAPGRGPVIG